MINKIKQLFQSAPEIKQPNRQEIGYAGSQLYQKGDISYFNPDTLMLKKGNSVYQSMMLDDQVKAVIKFKKGAILARDYFFEIENDEDGKPRKDHKEIADFFYAVINHIRGSFTDKLMGILSAIENGFSISEKVYEPFDYNGKSMWGLQDIKLRPFDTFLDGVGGFIIDVHGNIIGLNQWAGGYQIPIPIEKVIHFVYQPDVNPFYGESDLRACYRAYWGKDIAIKFQNIHLERHASGFIFGSVDGPLTDSDQTRLENALKNINTETAMILPKMIDIQHTTPVSTDQYEKAIAMYDKAIAKCTLVPNLLGITEQGTTGSYSQSEIQLKAFFWTIGTETKRLEETLDEQVFRQLAIWNFGTEDYPRFRFAPMTIDQATALAMSWGDLTQKGAVTKSASDENYIRNLLGFPEKEEDEEMEEPAEEMPEPELPIEDMAPEPDIEDEPEEDITPETMAWIKRHTSEEQANILQSFEDRPWLKRVNFAQTENLMNKNDDKYSEELTDVMAQVKLSIEKQIKKIVGPRSLGNVKATEFDKDLVIPKQYQTAITKVSRNNLKESMTDGFVLARKELPKKMNQELVWFQMGTAQAESFISSRAMQISGDLSNDTLQAVKNVLRNGIKFDWSLSQTMQALDDDAKLSEMLPDYELVTREGKEYARAINKPSRLETIVRTVNAEAFNEARSALFSSPEFKGFVQAYEYSAILDDRTTDICAYLNGRIAKDFANRTPPNHFNCRSLLIPVTMVDEWDGKTDKINGQDPQEGFGKL